LKKITIKYIIVIVVLISDLGKEYIILDNKDKHIAAIKINMLLAARQMTVSELAERLKTKAPNLSNKFKRNNFTEKDIKAIAKACNAKYSITFSLEDTGQQF
jgi:hypothetical protein